MDKPISQLPVANTITGDEVTVVVQAGVTKQTQVSQIANAISPGKLITSVNFDSNSNLIFNYSDGTSSSAGPIPGYISASIDGNGHLLLTNSLGYTTDVGSVVGPQGPTGPTGPSGAAGAAATIAVGTTTTGAPGTNATVTNSGTSSAAVFDFAIPRGAGVQVGGTTGQVLAKASNADYDTTWVSNGNGTVTSVSGTGTVSGISLSGTVTSSGDLTLGGTLDLSSPPAIGATTPSTGKFTSVTTPSVTATTADLTLNSVSSNAININNDVFKVYRNNTISSDTALFTAPALSYIPPQTGFGASILRATSQLQITSGSATPVALQTAATLGFNGTTQLNVSHTASAVNYVQVTGGATGNAPSISAQGSDSFISLNIQAKSANLSLGTRIGGNPSLQLLDSGASPANYFRIVGSATTLSPVLSAQGSDTNISMAFQPKGTGAINLAAGISGVNISNGGTVTAITRTAFGGGYTTVPSVLISAPTTAGGVQATASCTLAIATAGIGSGGTGYTVGDVLTFVGGTGTAGTATVGSVSGGVITTYSGYSNGNYSVVPPSPTTLTGGTGSGATLNLGWAVNTPINIVTAGSGYIDQPAVTFSGGGGGSGAAAYASVGSTTTVKGLYGGGSQIPIQFAGPGGNLLQIMESGNTSAPIPLVVKCGSSSTQLYPNGSNIPLQLSSSGTGALNFYTNTLAQEQLRITHTASAVNYVQVTGSTTGNRPTISAQGSDANISWALQSKGTFGITFLNGAGGIISSVTHSTTTTSTNYINLQGSAGGASNPAGIAASGADTNIDLSLTPKGTGVVVVNSTVRPTALTASQAVFTDASKNLVSVATTGTGSAVLSTSPTLTSPVMVGTLIEDVFTITDAAGFAIDPDNGSIQLVTLGASRTPTVANFAAGEAVTLMINDGTAFTITWTTIGVVWVGGTAPTLATTGFTVIELWRVGSTYYGALVGNVA
jgi:hypothetical protein